jgi:hypothetical protein
VVVSTQVPLQLLGVLPLHVPTHVDATQTGVPAPHACPHELQFAGSLVVSTQTPPHGVYPESHAKLQLPPVHVGWACATEMLQWLLHAPQFERSVCASTQTPPPQGVWPLEQPVAHAGGPPSPDGRQTGPPESALHDTEQPPQCAAVFSWTQTPLQSVYPVLHATVQALFTQAGCPFGSLIVHGAHDVPQAVAVLVVSTHAPLQSVVFAGQLAAHT